MKKIWLISVVALFAGVAAAAQSCVWKITKGSSTLYLGGTFHLLRAADFPLPPEFDLAFAQAKSLYFETDVARLAAPETQEILLGRATCPEGQSLDHTLNPKAWDAVRQFAERNGLPVESLAQFKPWMVVMMMTALELTKLGVTQQGVDVHYFDAAVAAGKSTHGLETFEQQLDFLTSMGAGHESEMILNSVAEMDYLPREFDTMLRAWKTGDVATIDKTMLAEMRQHSPDIYADLVVKRNQAWLPVIKTLLKSPEIEFVLVGAGHLAGPDGLLAALKKHGCQVEQVRASAAR